MNTTFQKYIVLTFGYRDLVGLEGSGGIGRIIKELQEYNLYAVLETCSKISVTLLSGGFADSLTQAKLLAGVFNDKNERLRFYEIAKARSQGTPWAIFNHQSLLVLVKLALQNCKNEGGKHVTPEGIDKLGYWLLILNDECFSYESGRNVILPIDSERERLRSALARYQFFHSSDRLGYRIGRYRWIVNYFRKSKPNDINIDLLFKEASGIPLDDYLSVCNALIVKWVNLANKNSDVIKNWLTCRDAYFAKSKLKKENVDLVLNEIMMDKLRFDKKLEESVGILGKDSTFYNFLPFIWYPLIKHPQKECFVCPSADYLYKKSTDGIYRTIETNLRIKEKEKTRQNFSIAWGKAFEEYINTSLKNSFGKLFTPNFQYENNQEIDGIIETDTKLFIIETKNHHWKYKAMITGDKDEMKTTLKHLFANKGLKQITKFIGSLQNANESVISSDNRLIIPILVLPDSIPQDTYNRKMYEEVASVNNALPVGKNVLPFIILSAEEIEMIEAIAKNAKPTIALQILFEYSNLYANRNQDGYVNESISLKNYMYHRGYENPERVSNNKRVMRLFDKVFDDVSIKVFGKKLRKKRKLSKKKS